MGDAHLVATKIIAGKNVKQNVGYCTNDVYMQRTIADSLAVLFRIPVPRRIP